MRPEREHGVPARSHGARGCRGDGGGGSSSGGSRAAAAEQAQHIARHIEQARSIGQRAHRRARTPAAVVRGGTKRPALWRKRRQPSGRPLCLQAPADGGPKPLWPSRPASATTGGGSQRARAAPRRAPPRRGTAPRGGMPCRFSLAPVRNASQQGYRAAGSKLDYSGNSGPITERERR